MFQLTIEFLCFEHCCPVEISQDSCKYLLRFIL